ncbi:MAG: geranylgeranylglycerol-phosphate geranylgeranyltransferase [Flavobacteriaceae bacterium]|nr:geranylgeranylglycerol-phosphate geranylgeranyltransferase [Flavobacteriaceae bacterium]
MNYLNLIRYKNLLIIILIQVLIRYALFIPLGADLTLSHFEFSLLVLATIFIAAAGNVINDIYDVEIDEINKPEKVIVGKSISEKTAYNLFVIFNIMGVGLGFYLTKQIEEDAFFGFFIVTSALLYLYATFLKSMLLVGNIIVSLLVAFSLIIVGVFDLFPSITFINQEFQSFVFGIVLNYALFAFHINLMREIVKDIEDIDGDKKGELNTLPIVIGRKRASYIVFGMGILSLFGIIFYIYTNLYNYTIAVIYFLSLILAPLGYFCIKIWDVKSKSDYSFLSKILKIIMLLGIGSLLLYTFVIQ